MRILFLLLFATPAFGQYAVIESDQGMGTGCLVSSDLMLTCYHAAHGELKVKMPQFETGAKLVDYDWASDIALLRLDKMSNVSPIKVAVAHFGEPVKIGGFAGTLDSWKYQEGKLFSRGINDHEGFGSMVTGVVPVHGNSGGCVLNQDGCLVGIVLTATKDAAIIHEFNVFLQRNPHPYRS
jgi:S1-C subfamily serine protease